MTADRTFNLDLLHIAVPEKARELLIDELLLSTRLGNVLQQMGCERLGDLHGRTYLDVWKEKNCGRKTLRELKTLIAESDSIEPAAGQPVAMPPLSSFSIPEHARDWPVTLNSSVPFAAITSVLDSERIEVPEQARNLLIDQLLLSTRLGNVLQQMECERLGDLQGRTYLEVWKERSCGRKTLYELKSLIVEIGSFYPPAPSEPAPDQPVAMPPPSSFSIPEHARDWPITLMPFSTRLAGILQQTGFRRLGNLHDLPFNDLLKVSYCGPTGIDEIKSLVKRVQEGEFDWIAQSEPNLRLLLDALERVIEKLPTREREIILCRFGGTDQTGQTWLTLREIGAEYNLSFERVRQILDAKLKLILKSAGPLIGLSLSRLVEKCLTEVCPLTPETLSHWLGEGAAQRQFPISFYIRLCGALRPEIPVWPDGQKHEAWAPGREKEMVRRLEELLSHSPASLSLSEALEWLQKGRPELSAQPADLLKTLKRCKSLLVEFVDPDRPTVRLAQAPVEPPVKKWKKIRKLAMDVLSESDRPLSRDEIIERARHKFGEDIDLVMTSRFWNVLKPEGEFYLLDRGAYGLRKHFRLPESLWDQVRSDFYGLLATEKRPISTAEVVNERRFEWAGLTNAYEIAHFLREDSRFVDLGRHLFALCDWGIEKREMIGDLIVKILEEAARPMHLDELFPKIKQSRSVARTTLRVHIQGRPEVCGYGAGYYGLKFWEDKATEFLITEPRFIAHFIIKLPPPLKFKELCRLLKIPDTGHLADHLWKTVLSLSNICRYAGANRAETMLRHRMWSLEYSLYAMLSQSDRPLSVSEIQEALGGCFDLTEKGFANRIKHCHQWSDLFACTRDGKYTLKEPPSDED